MRQRNPIISNILFILPSLKRAGAEAQAVSLANGLPSESFGKHLVFYLPDAELRDTIDANCVSVYHVKRRRKLDLGAAREIAKIIDIQNIDIVHCTLQNALLYGWVASILAKRRPALVCALHTTINVDRKNEIADRFVYGPILRSCDQTWFVCHRQAEVWKQRMPFLSDSHRVIYNGIDTGYYDRYEDVTDFREQHGLPNDCMVVSCIAGLRPEKGHVLLMNAFLEVSDRHESAVLAFAGRGPMERSLRDHAEKLGISDRVYFLGEIDDVRPLLAISACKVIASTAVETFSMAMLEAMAMQVPVLSSDIGGASEAIDHKRTGIVFDIFDFEALARGLDLILGDSNLRREFGRRSREKVESQFTRDKMLRSADLYLRQLSPQNAS